MLLFPQEKNILPQNEKPKLKIVQMGYFKNPCPNILNKLIQSLPKTLQHQKIICSSFMKMEIANFVIPSFLTWVVVAIMTFNLDFMEYPPLPNNKHVFLGANIVKSTICEETIAI
jgi:hypothetical protein